MSDHSCADCGERARFLCWEHFDKWALSEVDDRLRRIADRLRVPHGGLVPDAEVYVRAVLAKVIDEELEER